MIELGHTQAAQFIAKILALPESRTLDFKRVSGKMVGKALETLCAFANTDGGALVLGVEDPKKSSGIARFYGVQENPEAVDELQRKARVEFYPPIDTLFFVRVPCTLRDSTIGHLLLVQVSKSDKVHSIVNDGTWTRLDASNRQMTAAAITELSYQRGVRSAESESLPIALELLATDAWTRFVGARGLRSGGKAEQLFRIGLAEKVGSKILPRRAAVLLFAEEPGSLLAAHGTRADIRLMVYDGNVVKAGPTPNLRKQPKTIRGPLIDQIDEAVRAVQDELAQGITLSSSGFKTRHVYPDRVMKEAIVNAVIHRDYRLNRDIFIRIFDSRIEVESPGMFPGAITLANIASAGSKARNPLITTALREFPLPPNIDAGEGVRMMFAEMAADLLEQHPCLRQVVGLAYPTVFLDEFQDTNAHEWRLILELGRSCRLLALADPDQRIYEFRGADPARIGQFTAARSPLVIELGDDNHRSDGTDIVAFGNDLLTGRNRGKTYQQVKVVRWTYHSKSPVFQLRTQVLASLKRLIKHGRGWSVAVLVPTKRMMIQASDALNDGSRGLPPIHHTVSIDPEGPTLAARAIAYLMEPATEPLDKLDQIIGHVASFYRGRGGSDPNATDLKESTALETALRAYRTTGRLRSKSILGPIMETLKGLRAVTMSGDPESDWLAVRRHLDGCDCKRLRFIAAQARYVRLLGRGSQLRESLSASWRSHGRYADAVAIVDQAFAHEHFANSTRATRGVVVMNMHKAKGKEFDEVILYESDKHSRYRRHQSTDREAHQAVLNLRVSVTRARQRVTILTPDADPSPLIV